MTRFLPAAAALLLAACGYVGDPLPPLANVPSRIADLAAIQRGGRIIAQFTVPLLTTERRPIPQPLRLDLRAGTADHFAEDEWAGRARQIPPGTIAHGIARYEIPSAEWTGKDLILAVHTVAGNGKAAGWSNFVVVSVVPPPDRPTALTPTATPDGVRLTWQARGADFRVFRKTEGVDFVPLADAQKPEWIDAGAEFGQPYTYMVQTIVKLDNHKEAESDLSEEAAITPRDIFPPAAPAGVRPSPAPNSIELNWDRNTESDLNGYRVYRAEGNGALAMVADVAAVPSYSDGSVEHGKTYRYAVTAIDRAGNESARSGTVEVTMP
jgi:hypothetical protein